MAKPSFWLIHALGVGFLILVLGGNNTTSGQETGVVITEVMWDGLEYVELYNPGSSDVSLEGWQLVRSHDSQEEQDVIVVFSATDVVSTQSYFLLEKKEEATARAGDALAPSLVLHNDGNILRLLNSSGQVIDDVGRIGPWLAGQNTEAGVSMERIAPHSDGKEATSWRTATAILFGRVGSPGGAAEVVGSSEPIPSVSGSQDHIYISEVVPDPTGSDTEGEFIELFNAGEAEALLAEWKIDDIEGGSAAHTLADVVIEPHAYHVLYASETDLILNNNGDQVRLFDTTGQLHTSLTYGGDGGEGLSYSRTSNGGYVWTRAATPGEATRIIKPEQDTFPDRATRQSSVTPFAKATVPPSHQFSEEIVISAVLPNPIGEDTESEFIELHNRGTQTLRLAGWQLDDEEGGSKPFAFPATEALVAGERRAFSRALTGIALNNTADTARLLDPNGAVMSSLTYTEPAEEGVVVHSASGSYGAGEVHEEGERQEEGSVAGVKTTEPTAENNENRDQGTNTAHNDEQEHDLDAQAKEMGQTKHSIFSSERRRELAGPLTVGGLGIGALAWQLVGRGALREPLLRLLVRKK